MTLHEIGLKHKTDKATFHKYCDWYEQKLPKHVDRILEIGVMHGHSLMMWRDYYPDAQIIGIDLNTPEQIDGVQWLQINSNDINAIKDLGKFDLIVDDGSHNTLDQQVSLDCLWRNCLKPGGYYIMEDLHTSYMPNYVNSKYTTVTILEMQGGWEFHTPCDDVTVSLTAIKQKRKR